MAKIEEFEELEVWKRARIICNEIELLFQTTKLGDNYALRNQMDRSSGSIMDNIAEGFGRAGNKEFHNFLSYSKGSCTELKSQIYKSLISKEQYEKILDLLEVETNKIGAFMFYRNTNIKGQNLRKFKTVIIHPNPSTINSKPQTFLTVRILQPQTPNQLNAPKLHT